MKKHLDMLSGPQSWQSPLAVIAHIDLDAFYAQCQGVQLGIDPSEPLCCRQWHAVIAVNYPARKYGIKRGMAVTECQKLCPEVHLPHVATFKKGESVWKLHEDPEPRGYKVSLDLFRRESRKIFRIFKNNFKKVEKAGIDEGFVDLGPEVLEAALSKYPQLSEAKDKLPEPPSDFSNWHDVLLSIGADLVRACRERVFKELMYTCSAGIAPNKLLAKLGSGYNKPRNQTLVLSGECESFLDKFKLTDIWGWGGKTGKHVLSSLQIDEEDEEQIPKIRNLDKVEILAKLPSELASTLFEVVRGRAASEVSSRTIIKSMLSVKDFSRLTNLSTKEDLYPWIQVFVADICGRVADLEADEHKIFRPKTVTVRYYTPNGSLQSRQVSVTPENDLSTQLLAVSKQLADQNVPLPCHYLAIEISNIEELPRERVQFAPAPTEEEVSLFLDDETERWTCPQCRKIMNLGQRQEHEDWHMARSLQLSVEGTKTSPTKRRQEQSISQAKKARTAKGQKGIRDFFKPN